MSTIAISDMATQALPHSRKTEPIHADQVEFKLTPIEAPRYKFLKLAPSNQPSASVGLGAGSSTLLEWKLPANVVYNTARSYLEWNENAPGQAAGYNCAFEDTPAMISSIQFGAPGGQDIVNLQYAPNYAKVVRKITTPFEDYVTNEDMSLLYKCNTSAAGNIAPGGGTNGAGGLAGTDEYIETKYMASAVVGNGSLTGQTGRLDRYRQLPLSAYPGTFLGVDRDTISPTEMSLRINTSIGTKIMWNTTNTATPALNHLPIADVAGSTCSGAGKNITINNCYLFLCVEINPKINEKMQAYYASGQLVYSVPFTTAFRLVGASAGQQTNLQLQLSNLYGKKLKRVITTVWNPVESLESSYDCSNTNGSKVVSYQTLLNSFPLQTRVLSCFRPGLPLDTNGNVTLNVGMDDWMENRKFVDKRSCITSKEVYQLNWFHNDQFYEPRDRSQLLPEANLEEGLPMDAPVTWQFTALTGATSLPVFYVYAEFQRDIAITPAGPQYVGVI